MIISDACDMDLAIGDLLHSAFSHSGQKCSASSLAICTEKTYNSDRFRRQLKDGVTSLKAGKAHDISTQMAPLIRRASGKLLRALTVLDDGEWWLVKPQCLDADSTGRHWTGGVRMGVRRGSWFHRTEVFGPVLGVMCADGLAEGMEMQNDTAFGLTGGLHSLDEAEIKAWLSGVHVGNAYVNRGTTGAVVGRQCFGGWKTSVVGPGGKAGGPNYVGQLGVVRDGKRRDEKWVEEARRSDERWVRETKGDGLGVEICGLEVEWNLLRYCGVRVGVRVGEGANEFEMQRVREGIDRCGGVLVTWSDCRNEEVGMFVQRIRDLKIDRVRVLGRSEIEVLKIGAQQGFDVTTCGVVAEGEVELLHYVREQSISWTRHRFGNMALE